MNEEASKDTLGSTRKEKGGMCELEGKGIQTT